MEVEAAGLRQTVAALRPLGPLGHGHRTALARAEVAGALVGCNLPLSVLEAQLLGLHSGVPDVTPAAVRNLVLDLASRRSFAAKGAAAKTLDAMEDISEALLWQWELRDSKALPKALRPEAVQRKKELHKAADRLTALATAAAALAAAGKSKAADAKAARALAKLAVVEAPWPQAPGAAAAAAAGIPRPACLPGAGGAADAQVPANDGVPSQSGSPAAKRARAKAASAEREAAAAERERKKAEREAEKETARLEKEAARRAKEAAKAAGEEEKKAQKKGFKSAKALDKSRSFMDRFVKKAPASPEAARGTASASTSPVSAARQPRRLEFPYHQLFSPPPGHQRLAAGEARTAELDAALARPLESDELDDAQRCILEHWRGRARFVRVKGMPPTWARKAGADAASLAALLEREYGGGSGLAELPMWRRKYLWFSGDGSKRPPYYGSWSRASNVVTGRRPLARDDSMDYEVMSDQEWEEEPDGEDLSDGEADEEEEEPEESGGDGFVVGDAYLSDDEGLHSGCLGLDDLAAELHLDAAADEATSAERPAAAESVARERQTALLEEALRQARRKHLPLLVSRLPSAGRGVGGAAGNPDHARCQLADAALLDALQAHVVNPRAGPQLPPDIMAEDAGELPPAAAPPAGPAAAAPAAAGAAVAGAGGARRARPPAACPEDLAPVLAEFLLANPGTRAIAKVTQAFIDAHPDRKVTKNGDGTEEPTSTADPYWDRLFDAVAAPAPAGHGAGSGPGTLTPPLPGVFFDPGRLGRCAGAVPAAAAAALLKGLGSAAAPAALKAECARAAAHLAMVLTEQGAGAGAHAPTPSKVWRSERAAPVAASLEQLFAEPALMPTLAACLAARKPEEASLLLGALVKIGNLDPLEFLPAPAFVQAAGVEDNRSLAKHATMALAALLRDPAGADALLGRAPGREVPPGLAGAMCVRLCDANAREPVLLAALEVLRLVAAAGGLQLRAADELCGAVCALANPCSSVSSAVRAHAGAVWAALGGQA
ncbi:hypothetical protein WJX81_008416 [Elliptochloris bilobata]|uniref:Chromatin assembly factor 1 subunit A dimerization domain-containing protein n=1 Tax=Elliptochloris bilobata TaxID=381761 RepID=A0AAW1SM61_9CHLO